MTERNQTDRRPNFGTTAVHGGRKANETHAHVQPIYQSSTYRYDDVAHGQAIWKGETPGYIYSRLNNPNMAATAQTIAALEGIGLPEQPYCILTGSGMGAVSTVLITLAGQGDTLISQRALYGVTYKLLAEEMPRRGVTHDMFDGANLESLDAALARNQNIRAVYIESPVNPTMELTDIRGVVDRAHAAGALVVIDNTFATPYLQRPFEMGVDIIVHSTTKYLTGHGTVVGGAFLTRDQELFETRLVSNLINYGPVAGPMDAWLTGQGLKTFHLRMARHCQNGRVVAQFLEAHPAVARVNYPGLASFPQFQLAQTQMDDSGGMLSFELNGGYEAGRTLMDRVKLCTLTVSLGTVDTLIEHPASMTHFTLTPEERAAMGISEGLVRLSVGIEDIEDIIDDLAQGLSYIPK
jgi:methionine-gamma-lyase